MNAISDKTYFAIIQSRPLQKIASTTKIEPINTKTTGTDTFLNIFIYELYIRLINLTMYSQLP